MTFRYSSTTVEEDAIARLPEGFVIVARRDSRGVMTYHSLSADHTAKDRVIRGFGTVDDKIEAIPTMSQKEIEDSGLSSCVEDGRLTPRSERSMRERTAHRVDTRHVRRGTHYIYDTAREALGVGSLYEGTAADMATYRAMLEVVAASGRIERLHDPEAVHMTPALAAVVNSNVDRVDDIVRYIGEHKVTARDLDADHLQEFLDDVHRSVGDGFL
jgi:hypothetical protein